MRLLPDRHARLATTCATILVAFAACALAPAGAAAGTLGCADDATGVTDQTAAWEAELLRLTNEHRTGMGLVALQLDTTLTRASVWKARDMARRNYFAHDDQASADAPARTPWDRLAACGWTTGGSRAENIAAGYGSPQDVITGWLNSPGHRANIENAALRYVGFGVATGASSAYGTYSVQLFASVAGPSSTVPVVLTPTPTTPAPDPGGDGGDQDGVTRDPFEQVGGGTPAATAIADVSVRVVRVRCADGRVGSCWQLVVRGRVSSTDAAGRTVVIQRRTASGRLVRVASLRSSQAGTFYRAAVITPPTRDTATWLRRNASSIRIAVAASATATGAARWTTSRIPLRRR